jgi:O-antigen/teichoic acid export membrane protein
MTDLPSNDAARPTGSPDRTWIRATAAVVIVLLASSGIDYLTQILLGNWLGEEHYGDYGVAVSAALLFAYFATLGADESLPRFVPTYRSEGKIAHAMGFLRVHLQAIVVVSLIIGIGGMTLFLLIDHKSIDHPITVVWWLVPPLALAEFLYISIYNFDRVVPAMVIHTILLPLAVLGAAAVFRVVEGRLTDDRTIMAYGFGALAVLPVYGVMVRRTLPKGAWRIKPKYDLRLWIRTAAPMLASTVAYYALGQTDVYAMEHVGAEREVGILVACSKTADFVYLSYSAVYLLIASRVAPLVEGGRTEELRALVRTAARSVLGLSLVAAAIIVGLGHFILGWFGHGFADGYVPLVVLAIANVGIAVLSLAWPILSLAGHERVPLPGLIVALVALFLSVEAVVPRYAILGAVLCKAGVMTLLFAWLAWQLKRRTGIRVWRVW